MQNWIGECLANERSNEEKEEEKINNWIIIIPWYYVLCTVYSVCMRYEVWEKESLFFHLASCNYKYFVHAHVWAYESWLDKPGFILYYSVVLVILAIRIMYNNWVNRYLCSVIKRCKKDWTEICSFAFSLSRYRLAHHSVAMSNGTSILLCHGYMNKYCIRAVGKFQFLKIIICETWNGYNINSLSHRIWHLAHGS